MCLSHLSQVGVLQVLSTLGEVYLILYIFPQLDSINVMISMTQTALVPAILQSLVPLLRRRLPRKPRGICFHFLTAVCPLVLIIGSCALQAIFLMPKAASSNLKWLLPLCVGAKSVWFWDNFVSHRDKEEILISADNEPLKKEKLRTISSENHKRTLITSGARLLVCVTFYCLIVFNVNDLALKRTPQGFNNTATNIHTCSHSNSVLQSICNFYQSYSYEIRIVILACLIPPLSTMASRFQLQRIGFTLPILAVPLCSFALVWTSCLTSNELNTFFQFDFVCFIKSEAHDKYMFMSASFVYVALVAMTWYLWLPNIEKMAKLER